MASRSVSRDKLNNKFPTFQPNSTKNERYYQNLNDRHTVTSEDDEINGAETELVSKSANKLLRIIKTPTRLGLDYKSPQGEGHQLFDENYSGTLTGLMRGQQLINELRCHSPLILK